MPAPVHILGGYQTDFARKWSTVSEQPLFDMFYEAVSGCLESTEVDARDIETAHVGNLSSPALAGQSHLAAMVPMLHSSWSWLPAARHEAACASGSVAALAAMAEIEAGRYDVALVTGVELMRDMPATVVDESNIAAWGSDEITPGVSPWPGLFGRVRAEIEQRYGNVDSTHLARIARINRDNARRNPLAHTRDWVDSPGEFDEDDLANPWVTDVLRKSDCGRITDGACAIVLASDRFMRQWERRHSSHAAGASTIGGWGHQSASIPLADRLAASKNDDYIFGNVRRAITDAYDRAKISGPESLDVIETHDCFTVNEYVAIDHFGLTKPGQAWQAIEDGQIAFDGRLPVNPSGGLIGAGHPIGATGVRMLLDAHKQVTGTAGDYQVAGTHTAATLNIGGCGSTAVSFVVQAN